MKDTIKALRTRSGLSQIKFSAFLGVSVASLRRWEAGDAFPSPMAKEKIDAAMSLSDEELLNLCSQIDIKEDFVPAEAYLTTFNFNGKSYQAEWMPYVINGPTDQLDFYKKLVELQQEASINLQKEQYFSRLSMLHSVDGLETSQYKMEHPNRNSKSWSSDYGTHGFHRYVGRFPSHLIRALINAFGATAEDIVLDPFCGSGTTLVEARMLGVKTIGIEISPLSAMISRVKSQFPENGFPVADLLSELETFYYDRWNAFLSTKSLDNVNYDDILNRAGNSVKRFLNVERWFSKDALLGISIIVEFILTKTGYVKDFLTIALSSKMRSIGNVDVDVVRAEYRKTPRENVDVLKLVSSQIRKMSSGITATIDACKKTLGPASDVKIIENSVLTTEIERGSIAHIITSPPYGVESLSYLRTHLLSFRALESILGVDPYNFGEGIIGSEYLDDEVPDVNQFMVKNVSQTYVSYFSKLLSEAEKPLDQKRIVMMMKFFEDMYEVIGRFSIWLKKYGKVAFIIGNKKIGDSIIPTDKIINEIFESFGFQLMDSIAHKLKTNNSNSQVPWQDRIIENEYVLLFQKVKECE
jgi:site-specific DNA-methyltransferase (cytosine-N4-specific)